MADKTVRGRFVWHELITPDTAGAHAFYTKALGWKTQAWDQDPTYTMFVAASGPLGGSVGRPSEAARWLPYIGTEYIEGTVDQARSLGARVLTDVTGMANGGKYAVLEDPQGAAFGVYASATEPTPESAPKLGEYSWHELATNDFRAAFDFYSALFGWEAIAEHDMGAPLGTYFTFGRGGTEMGGMFKRMADMPGGPSWLGYVRVKDIQQVVKRAKSAGGTLLVGPMEVPGGDLIAQFNDPQGGMFAVHTLAADIKRAAPPAASAPAPQSDTAGAESTEEQAAAAGAARRAAGKKAAAKAAAKPAAKKAKGKAAGARKNAKKSAKKQAKSAKKRAAKKAAPRKAARAAKGKAAKKRVAAARGAKRAPRKVARGSKAKKSTRKSAGGKKAGKARKAK